MRLKLYAAVLLWTPFLASAGTNTWSALGPSGASLQVMAFGKNSGTVFAAGVSGVYRSVDDGADWQVVKTDFPGNTPSGLAIDPSDANRLYVVAATWPSLYVSTDGGATLQANTSLPTSAAAGQIGVSHDGQTLYIISAGQVFVSTDRGVTWAPRTAISSDPVALPTGIIVDPADPNTVYVSIQLTSTLVEEVAGTHDGGMTWQVLNSASASNGPPPVVAINPSNPLQLWMARYDGVWTSPDQGASWTNVLASGLNLAPPMLAMAVDPENPASVFAVDVEGVVWHSTDNGGHWTSATGSPSAGQVNVIAVDPARSNRILEVGNSGVAGSSDTGSTWSAQEGGLLASNIEAISVDPVTGLLYASVSTEGVYSATPGASSFLPVNNPELFALQYNTANPPVTTIYVSALLAQPGRLLAGMVGGLVTSLDGGNDWTLSTVIPAGGGSQQILQLASSTANPQTVLAGGVSSLYLTVDGGSTWSAAGNGLPANASVNRVFVAPSNGQVAYTQESDGSGVALYHSSDAGMNWAPVTITSTASPTLLLAVDPGAPTTVYGATDQTLLKSTDGGNTWSTLPYTLTGGAPDLMAVDPVHPQIFITSRVSGVARSVDSGSTWESVQPGSSGWDISSLVLDPLHPETITVGTYNFGAQQITIAPDLSLTGTAPAGPVTSGSAVTFGFTVDNLGPFAATDVTVTVPLPAMTQSSTATGSGATCDATATSATCRFPVLRSGASAGITVAVNGVPTGSVQVVGTVTADQPDANPQNNSVTLATSVAASAPAATTSTPDSTTSAPAAKGGGGGLSLWELLLLGAVVGAVRRTPGFRSQCRRGLTR